MYGLRRHDAAGAMVAKSGDGTTFYSEVDGSIFAQRSGNNFIFSDRTIGMRRGDVVFIRDDAGRETPTFRLEDCVARARRHRVGRSSPVEH
jgi:hypothetical protein